MCRWQQDKIQLLVLVFIREGIRNGPGSLDCMHCIDHLAPAEYSLWSLTEFICYCSNDNNTFLYLIVP